MVSTMKEKYETYKQNRNFLLNYDEILLFYPDYFKTKVLLENQEIVSKEEVDKYFEDNYKESNLYKRLVKLAMDEQEIYELMKQNKDIKYENIKNIYDKARKCSINLCDLIDYIGHYPITYPVPKEEEKKPEMEQLLEKYDIIVRYYMYEDMDEMQILSDDIVRIIEKLEETLNLINITINILSNNDWMFKRINFKSTEATQHIINEIDDFPLSTSQEQGKSHREEGKKYLRINHGKNII